MKNNITKYIAVFSLVFGLSACEKDWLDINVDPNNPTVAQLNQLLPGSQTDLAGSLGTNTGGLSNITSSYMHHFVQRGNNENDYNPNGDNFNIETPWRTLFTRTLTDLRELINIGTDQESWHYVGVAQIMKAYSYSVMVDVWGDLPFSEALQGESIKDPVFDSDQSIYSSLFSLIDEGIANLAKQSFQSPGLDDLIYGGDLDLWRKFGKTLKLKLYNQVRLVQNVSGEVNALISEGDLISSAAEDFEFVYGPTISPDNRNPGYTQEWAPGGQFYYPSPYIFELMKGINTFHTNDLLAGIEDPRIPYYFYNQLGATADDSDAENDCSYCPSRSGTGFLSIWMFSFNIDPNEGFDQSSSQAVIGEYALGGKYDDGIGGISNFNGTGLAPQKLLNYYARLFIEAELAHAGVTSGDPRALFENAVRAALAKVRSGPQCPSGSPGLDRQLRLRRPRRRARHGPTRWSL